MQYKPDEIIVTALNELVMHKNKALVLFVLISLGVLAIGFNWPKVYTSSSIIFVDDRNIIQPLMQGAAVVTESRDHSKNASEIILGRKILSSVLEVAGWLESNPSMIEIDQILEDIKKRTEIRSVGQNLIRIQYEDDDPRRAFITVKQMAAMYVNEGKDAKVEESRAAYEFIENQADEYLQKLTTVDKKLKDFLASNPDARPGSETQITAQIERLKRDIDNTSLQLSEAGIRKTSLQSQLSGEAAITISQSKEGQYQAKINQLQDELESLLLTYTETYPDVKKIRHKIEVLKEAMIKEVQYRDKAVELAKKEGRTYLDQNIVANPIYNTLRANLSETETEIATLQARNSEMKVMLKSEYDRLRRIQEGEAMMQQLTRDYEVNQEIYQDLLRRRENARVSRSLDAEKQGFTFKIQEEAQMPLRPTGIRFLHFIILGLAMGVIAPIGIAYMYIQLDPRIRSVRYLNNELEIPVIAEIPQYSIDSDNRYLNINSYIFIFTVIIVFVLYGYAGWLKYTGV